VPDHPVRAVRFIAVLCALLYANWLLMVARFQPNVMFWDQWQFYLPLFQDGGWWARALQQNGPVREGLGLVVSGWVLEATQWDVRYDSIWTASVLLVAAALAVRLKWRMTGAIRFHDAWIPLMFMGAGQYETVLAVPQVSHSVLPLALTLLAANVWLSSSAVLQYLGTAAVGVVLTFTGFGLFAAGVIALLLAAGLVRHALKREGRMMWLAVAGIGVSAAGWALFMRGYEFQPAVENFRFPWTPASDYARFISLMLNLSAGEMGQWLPPYLLGSVLALIITAAAVHIAWAWLSHPSPRHDVLLLLMGSGLIFVAATAIGRVSIGPVAGTAPRYLSLMIPMWLAVYCAAALSGRRLVRPAAAVCVAVLAASPYVSVLDRPMAEWPGTIGLTRAYHDSVLHYGTNKAAWADVYLATGSWETAQAELRDFLHPNPTGSHFDDKFHFLRERKLSFFAGEPARGDYMPWLADDNFRKLVTLRKE
jgi:hypothetical protein